MGERKKTIRIEDRDVRPEDGAQLITATTCDSLQEERKEEKRPTNRTDNYPPSHSGQTLVSIRFFFFVFRQMYVMKIWDFWRVFPKNSSKFFQAERGFFDLIKTIISTSMNTEKKKALTSYLVSKLQ